ncbi:hypothetical protein BBJ28_00006262 [Nothophytophthora sp. Chile5]|nr:hypothetical protein BBJ28_00006262 [Nothophytophthora sp. Chile5]
MLTKVSAAAEGRSFSLLRVVERCGDHNKSKLRVLLPSGYDAPHRTESDSALLGRNPSDSVLNSTATAVLQPQKRRGRGRKRASKERRAERRRQQLPKLKRSFSETWVEEIFPLPSGSSREDAPLLDGLCFAGIPKELRGRAWAWMLGNTLQVNEDLFRICKARAQAVLMEMSLKREVDHSVIKTPAVSTSSVSAAPESPARSISSGSSASSSSAEVDGKAGEASGTMANGEHKSERRSSVAALPTQNMLQDAVSIAEMLVAHGERSIRLVNIDMPRTFGHHPLFQPGAEGTERTTEVLEAYICYRPDLGYVQGMSYLAATLCFHLDSFSAFKALVALMSTSMLFDMFRLEPTRVRLLALFQDSLLTMEAEEIMRLLHDFPKATSSRELFSAISSVSLSCQEITKLLAGGKLWSPDAVRQVPVKYPEARGPTEGGTGTRISLLLTPTKAPPEAPTDMATRTKKSAFVAFNQLRVSSDIESDDSADERQQEKREKQKQKKKSRNKKKNSDSAQLKDLAFCAVSKPKKSKTKGKSKPAAQPGPPPEEPPAEATPTGDSQTGQEVWQGVPEPKRALADVIKGPPPADVKQHETNHAPSPKQPHQQQPRAPTPAASPPAAGAPPSTSEAELGAVYSPTTIKITRVDGQLTRMVAVSDVMDQLLLFGQQNSQLLMVQEQLGVRNHASLAVGKCLAIARRAASVLLTQVVVMLLLLSTQTGASKTSCSGAVVRLDAPLHALVCKGAISLPSTLLRASIAEHGVCD